MKISAAFALFFFLFLPFILLSQSSEKENKLDSKIERVTVFFKGAQLVREASCHLPKGKSVWLVEGLSPYINKASLQVRGEGDFTILGIHLRRNLMTEQTRSEKIKKIEKEIELLKDSLEYLNAEWELVQEEQQFLEQNRRISGENTSYSLEDLRQIRDYYMQRMEALSAARLRISEQRTGLNMRLEKYNKQLSELADRPVDVGSNELIIELKAGQPLQARFEISYMVENAAWFPTYDVRVKSIEEPLRLVYQANMQQNTREDWEQVKLAFSNARPNLSGQAPDLLPYRLRYGMRRPSPYRTAYSDGILRGYVRDADTGEPLIGANILITGSSIGTITDYDGYYELPLPASVSGIEVSYVGYSTQRVSGIPSQGGQINIDLSQGGVLFEEVTVRGARSDATHGYIAGSRAENARKKDKESNVNQVEAIFNTTSVEFELEEPYSVPSGKSQLKLDLEQLEIPASYVYETTPKLDETAYLLAYVEDWRKYNLLDGEMRLYFENTFTGRSVLDLSEAGDTLELSLGRDEGIEVKRELIREGSRKWILSGKQVVSRAYRITLRNNKREAIRIRIHDQVPLSTDKAIEVAVKELSHGQLNEETGEVLWEIELAPGASTTLENAYEVKFPKGRELFVE